MISTSGDPQTLCIRFHEDHTPVNRFLRVDPHVTFKTIHFQLFDAGGCHLIVEQMAVMVGKQVRLPFTKTAGVHDIAVFDCPSSGTFRYHVESDLMCSPPAYLQFTTATSTNVNVQTVLSKWTTPEEFKTAIVPSLRDSGYNMVHMVPVQERGLSDSPYSIRDQLSLSKDFNTATAPPHQVLASMIDTARAHGIRCMVDVVWNHTACDSGWLTEHPEAGYTVDTAPHLRAALEVDEAMLMYSQRFADCDGKVESEADLDAICDGFAAVVEGLRLEEYFLLDINKHLAAFQPTASEAAVSHLMAFTVLQDGTFDRFSHHLNMQSVNRHYRSPQEIERFRTELLAINAERQRLADDVKAAIRSNTKARVRYERLAADGPRLGPVSAHQPLLSPYFTRLFPCCTDGPAGDTGKDNRPIAFANNGWVWDADPLVNFADAPGLPYLRRDIIIWGDCVKLRYGTSPPDSPWLWEHMKRYTQSMACQFDGLRIDNCHSTPLPVAKYLLGAARAVNPGIYVVAELFTGRPDRDELFVGELGLDSLIREAMQCHDANDLRRAVMRFAGSSGVTAHPHALLMDCTHDNPAPAQKRTVEDAYTTAAIVSMAPCAVGSVRGFDSMIPEHLNIVFEQRHYGNSGSLSPIEQLKAFIFELKRKHEHWMVSCSEQDGLVTVTATTSDGDKEYVLLAKTVFTPHEPSIPYTLPPNAKILHSARIIVDHQSYNHNTDRITGFTSHIEPMGGTIDELSPGSVVLLEMPTHNTQSHIDAFHTDTSNFAAFAGLSVSDLNMLLYRTDAEERDMSPPYGVYVVPEFGPLPYCGIAGFVLPVMQDDYGVMRHSDPFTSNARNGTWMLDYTLDRLRDRMFDVGVVDCLSRLFGLIRVLPGPQRARETLRAFGRIYDVCVLRAKALCCADRQSKADFDLSLALGVVQMYGQVASTGYHPTRHSSSLAAGLPHFATHHMRCWGRDTFTAYKGFFLSSNRLVEGTAVIKAFAGCLFKGLIPNLLDAGRFPRFNSRDAVWWFVYAVVEHALVDRSILEEQVELRFPDGTYSDYTEWLQLVEKPKLTIKEILKQIFQQHAQGITFREFNAGAQLDAHMRDDGFNVHIYVDWSTGFIHGGNAHNCGTWMDKMGHIHNVNKGQPATPRNGANVEINALCLYAMPKVAELVGDFEVYSNVLLSEWTCLLGNNFTPTFYDQQIKCYKDVHDSGEVRPNFLIATALLDLPVADVREAIDTAIDDLLPSGPKAIGMRTLSNKHPNYNPNYSLNDQTGGHNYHNGPEWPWLTGFFLMSLRRLISRGHDQYAVVYEEVVERVKRHISLNPFGGIVELTNKDGQGCPHSCATQAWSMACIRAALSE